MPQASKKRRRQVRHLAAESRMTASANMDQLLLRQVLHVSAVSLRVGNPQSLGHTALENAFADWLIETISASPNLRTMSKKEVVSRGTRQFGLSERRAKALREKVIDHLNSRAWSKAGAPPGRSHRRT